MSLHLQHLDHQWYALMATILNKRKVALSNTSAILIFMRRYLLVCTSLSMGLLYAVTAVAQSITSDDTTGTIITTEDNTFNITGGTLSGDGENLFHSFQQFGLTENQLANFLSNPEITNILGRVTGGDPSLINGLVEIQGGDANLFLMNPAGIIFGNQAQLNINGDFTATTATGIGFTGGWFNAVGNNDYGNLNGSPNTFSFATSQPGAIINTGELEVTTGKNLSLVGGTVISTGKLAASEGNLNVTTVPGSSLVRLSQPGQLLSLEILPPTDSQGNNLAITPLMLPELLTGSEVTQATGLTPDSVNVQTGDVVVNQVTAGNGVIAATGNLNLTESELITTENLNLLAEDTVIIRDSQNNPFVAYAGKDLYIQGNLGIDILAINNLQQTPIISGGNLTLVSDGNISLDAHFASGGSFSILDLSGAVGSFSSLYDPIISSTEDVTFGNYQGPSLKVESQGSINVTGDITITTQDGVIQSFCEAGNCSEDAQLLGDEPALILRAGVEALQEVDLIADLNDFGDDNSGVIPPALNTNTGTTFNSTGNTSSPGDVTVSGTITVGFQNIEGVQNQPGGTAIISATGDIVTGDINTFAVDPNTLQEFVGGAVSIDSGGNITTGNINASASGDFNSTTGGSVTLTAEGEITTLDIDTTTTAVGVGDLNVTSGSVTFSASTAINTGNINTSALAQNDDTGGFGNAIATAGAVSLETGNTPGNNITFSTIDTTATAIFPFGDEVTATGGNVEILATGVVQGTEVIPEVEGVGDTTINTQGTTANGTVNIQHDGGADNVPFIIGDATENGTAGFINTGAETLTEGEFPNPGIETSEQATISFNFINTPPEVSLETQLEEIEAGESVSFTLEDLGITVEDVNEDNTEVVIAEINNGTLTRETDGTEIEAGETVAVDETLVYTPDEALTGEVEAFTVSGSDRVSNSEPQTVGINISEIPEEEVPETPEIPTEEEEIDDPEIITDTSDPQPPTFEPPPTNTYNPPPVSVDPVFGRVDTSVTDDFAQYLGIPLPNIKTIEESREILQGIEDATGVKPALIYISFTPTTVEESGKPGVKQDSSAPILPADDDQLEIVLITAKEQAVIKRLTVTREQVKKITRRFQASVTNPSRGKRYLTPAQQLYQWFIAPITEELQQREINNLVFLPVQGFRAIPFAALHNGEGFLVENYSVGLMPSISLTDTRYVDIRDTEILAMGAATFQEQNPLPAVPVELSTITKQLWQGRSFLNESFTLNNLKQIRSQTPYGILHLATHAEFRPGKPSNSYIQFWQNRLRLDDLRELGLSDERTQLLVLSACRTAVGDEDAELGFAGLAVQAGVKSALGSLWYVSDEGTLGLMTSFYEELKQAPIKAEALRQAQLALIQGRTKITQGQLITPEATIPLPTELADLPSRDLTHPYFWSAFTVIGNPW